ncbi:TPA: hypothetical protein ACHUV1_004440, partial [Shigella sonnei]
VMNIDNWAIPITSLGGQLLGVELVSHVEREGIRQIGLWEEEVLHGQLMLIESKAAWFRDNGLYCVITTGRGEPYEYLPFLRQMTRDMKVHNQQWLDDLGVHGGSAIPLVTGDFEVARLNRRYTEENIDRLIFPVLIKSIRQYCEKVIVPVRDKTYYPILREAGVWAVQGEFRPMRFEQCEKLIG